MSRLTNTIREDVIKSVKQETIMPRYNALMKQLTAACQKAADKLHPPKVQKWLEAMPKEAKGLLSTAGSVYPRIDGEKFFDPIDAEGKDRSRFYTPSVSLPNPIYRTLCWSGDVEVPTKFQVDMDQIWADWQCLRSTLKAAVYSCTTRKQLEEKYPDLAKHLPKPVVQTKALTITEEKVKEAIKCASEGGCE